MIGYQRPEHLPNRVEERENLPKWPRQLIAAMDDFLLLVSPTLENAEKTWLAGSDVSESHQRDNPNFKLCSHFL